MANPQPDRYTRISNELYEAIMQTDFSKRQRNVIDLVLRMSYGCGKKFAILKLSDFEVVGIYKTHVKKELEFLSKAKVLVVDGEIFMLNKNYDEWRVSIAKSSNTDRLKEILRRNLMSIQNEQVDLVKNVTETVTNEISETAADGVTEMVTEVTELVTNVTEMVTDDITETINEVTETVTNVTDSVTNEITEIVTKVTETVTNVTEMVTNDNAEGYQNSNHGVTKTVTPIPFKPLGDNGFGARKESIKEIINNTSSTAAAEENDFSTTFEKNEVKVAEVFYKCFGKHPNAYQLDEINQLIDKDGMEEKLICYALEKAGKVGAGYNYAAKILADWSQKGIKSFHDAEHEQATYEQKKNRERNTQNQGVDIISASLDPDDPLDNMFVMGWQKNSGGRVRVPEYIIAQEVALKYMELGMSWEEAKTAYDERKTRILQNY